MVFMGVTCRQKSHSFTFRWCFPSAEPTRKVLFYGSAPWLQKHLTNSLNIQVPFHCLFPVSDFVVPLDLKKYNSSCRIFLPFSFFPFPFLFLFISCFLVQGVTMQKIIISEEKQNSTTTKNCKAAVAMPDHYAKNNNFPNHMLGKFASKLMKVPQYFPW